MQELSTEIRELSATAGAETRTKAPTFTVHLCIWQKLLSKRLTLDPSYTFTFYQFFLSLRIERIAHDHGVVSVMLCFYSKSIVICAES